MNPIPIAFQGEPGAYSHEAIAKFASKHNLNLEPVPTKDFDSLFEAILNETHLGMVPTENSTFGIVAPTMDLLLQNELWIVAEYHLPVRHQLIGWKKENGSLEGEIVHSHPVAIGQCKNFISDNKLVIKYEDDTAGSVKLISELKGDERYNHFAIASRQAAELYGLDIIAEDIHNNPKNTTRFKLVRPASAFFEFEELIARGKKLKATVSYSVKTWKLYKVLSLVQERGFSTTYIGSRPIEDHDSDRVYSRIFYSDISGFSNVKRFNRLIDGIKEVIGDNNVKVYGIYPSSRVSQK